LAKYIVWLHGGAWGATIAGVAFVLPSFLMVLTWAAAYVHFGQLAWIQGLFYGIGVAVSAIIVRSAWKLILKTIGWDYVLWALFLLVAVTTVWTQSEMVWLFILSGIIAVVLKAPPKLQEKAAHVLALTPVIGGVFGSFSAGTVTSIFLLFKGGSVRLWERPVLQGAEY
jgi:chromate transporter